MPTGSIISLFLLFILILLCKCNSGEEKYIKSKAEVKKQMDSIEFKRLAVSFSEGKQLFSRFCNGCHYAPEREVLDQYTFDNLFQRLPEPAEEYFIKYISNSQTLKASGNEYAKLVDKVWDNLYEHRFEDSLSANNFTDLIIYIKIASKQRYKKKAG